MSRALVIVESPAKAKTIGKYLGDDFVVESSIGHIRDLARPSELSKEVKAKNTYIKTYAVDVEDDFKPLYIVSPDRKKHIAQLKKVLKQSDELLLATDEDREGESIAWHLVEVLNPKVPVKRMVFHEITKKAILQAVDNPREIDTRLVDAQEARRILDRLYGFAMSDMSRRKSRGKSAGRVQSVATRIVVERERERIAFVRAAYWDLDGLFTTQDDEKFKAEIKEVDGKRVATGQSFGPDGKLKKDVVCLDETEANELAKDLKGKTFTVASVETRPLTRRPAPPFMTSTLQQEAGRKFGWGARSTMRVAQRLYETGYITYMRTDSTTLSDTALSAARKQIKELYGADYVPKEPRIYKRKVKNAQEAHEAIRPAGDEFKMPAQVAKEVGKQEAKLYELVWKRTVASQMADAKGQSLSVTLEANDSKSRKVVFGVSGQTITFPGFQKAYVEGSDDPEADLAKNEKQLPPLKKSQKVTAKDLEVAGHETKPPARYTEASLVKTLEQLGVGRPSTYASIMSVIQDRGYVWKKGRALVPSFKAFQVVRLLEEHFGDLVDYQFTARMEDDLDAIASGDGKRSKYLEEFFLGDEGLETRVKTKMDEIDLDEVKRLETFPLGKTEDGQAVVIRMGQYGPYVQTGADDDKKTASIPDDMPPDELDLAKALELLDAPSGDRELGSDPDTGLTIFLKAGRYGPYVQLGEGGKDKEKPKTASLLQSMKPEELTLDDALKLLSLPREVGIAADGEPVMAFNGRYGPYIVHNKENRSLENEDQLFTITLEDALKLLAQPKKRRGRQQKPPLREIGVDPVSEKMIVLKEGRWGEYVTDGETNASLRTGDDPKTIDVVRAAELLQLRRERQATKPKKKKATKKKKSTKKKTTKKAAKKATKKTTKKRTTKKKAAKKKSVKKAAKKSTKKKATKKATKKSPTADA